MDEQEAVSNKIHSLELQVDQIGQHKHHPKPEHQTDRGVQQTTEPEPDVQKGD